VNNLNVKDLVVNVFMKLVRDEKLLDLIEVPEPRDMRQLRYQVKDIRYPTDLRDSKLTRICFFEVGTSQMKPPVERGRIEFDVYVHRDQHEKDRRALMIIDHLTEMLDGFSGVGIEMHYEKRLGELTSNAEQWVRYGVAFYYDLIRL
jgi:hypothetical protein